MIDAERSTAFHTGRDNYNAAESQETCELRNRVKSSANERGRARMMYRSRGARNNVNIAVRHRNTFAAFYSVFRSVQRVFRAIAARRYFNAPGDCRKPANVYLGRSGDHAHATSSENVRCLEVFAIWRRPLREVSLYFAYVDLDDRQQVRRSRERKRFFNVNF